MTKHNSRIWHVFDTCIWIPLIEDPRFQRLFENICLLAENGDILVSVPEVVNYELRSPEFCDTQKIRKGWRDSVWRLKQLANICSLEESLSDKARCAVELLDWLKRQAGAFGGNPQLSKLHSLIDEGHVQVHSLPVSRMREVIELGKRNRRPFRKGKNSVADASILAIAHHLSTLRATKEVVFHTCNLKDFSDPENWGMYHPQLVSYFGGDSKLRYSFGMEGVVKLAPDIEPIDLLIYYDELRRDPNGCSVCEGATPIDTAVCSRCGHFETSHDCTDEYVLYPYGDLFRIELLTGDYERYILECGACGGRRFELELEDLCSYHRYQAER